jgi:drug/metabolite transporter (DMT)-like permease
MKTTETLEEVEIESGPIKVARLTALGSVLFWPLFLFAAKFMLDPPLKNSAAEVERTALVYCTWVYPVAVGVGWLLSKRAMRRGSPDIVCLLPWLIPALLACYWLVYFFL